MLERCLWSETYQPTSLPAYPLPSSTDVPITGGGYPGLAGAGDLARRGVDCTVLEQHHLGWGASSRNGGFVLQGFKPEVEKVARMVGSGRAKRMFQLSLDAMRLIERLISEEEIACDFSRSGALTLAAKRSHLPWLERSAHFLRHQLRYETQLLAPADLSGEIGSLRYHGALLDPGGCSLQPAKYVRGLALAAERAGARLLEQTEVTSVKKRGAVFEVQTSRGSLRARDVLAATNGYTPRALPKLRRRVIPIGSYIIATEPLTDDMAGRLLPRGRGLRANQ